MNAKTIRTLSVTGIIASLLIAVSPAWADYGHHYGYPTRHVYPYRPAVVVVPPVDPYAYPPAPVYYVPPPVYVPAPVHYRLPLRVHHWPGRRLTFRG